MAPKLTYNVVSVQFRLRWQSTRALSVFSRNCSTDDRKWTWASHDHLHWPQSLQPCPGTVSDGSQFL